MPEVKLPERVGCSYILWSKDAGIITKWDGFDALNGKYNINIETTLGVGSKVNKHQYLAVITFDASSYGKLWCFTKNCRQSSKTCQRTKYLLAS